jgi:demethylmenaquinone methyltransferase/2-methoxy-6-polyprenyl-1,4-benzoquinol methylase
LPRYNNRPAPNRELAREKYRRLAGGYDRLGRIRLAEAVRREAVGRLELKAGDVALDVACGTGLSFPLLEERIGPEGRLIGVDLSPEMLARAHEKVDQAGWQNVTLIEAAVEDAAVPEQVDAIFFHFTHDVMRNRAALENVFRHAKPGARVVSAGGKRAPWWAVPVNLVMWRISRRYITTFEGFTRPWSHLKQYVPDLRVKPVLFGAGYIAWGRTRE